MSNERSLRVATLCAAGLAFPFGIATTIVSLEIAQNNWWYGRDVTAFCFVYIPLAATFALSIASLRYNYKKTKQPSHTFALLDLVAAISYLAILLPIWIVEIGENGTAMALLAGYLTTMMMFNMFTHAYLSLRLIGRGFFSIFRRNPTQCPNCKCNLLPPSAQVTQKDQVPTTYTWLRGEEYLDEEAVPIMDPRVSEDTIQSDDETVRGGSKGKIVAEI